MCRFHVVMGVHLHGVSVVCNWDICFNSVAGLRKSEAIAVTFFVTAILFTIGVAGTTALLMCFFCIKGNKAKRTSAENGHSEKHEMKHESSYSSKSSNASTPPKKRPPAPPRTKI